MMATGGKLSVAGFALALTALLVPGLAYVTAAVSATVTAPPVAAALHITSARPRPAGQSVPVGRSVVAGRSVKTALSAPRAEGCGAVSYHVIPARGDISNPAGTGGGYFWWRVHSRIMCIGTIRMWVHYPKRVYVHWLVGIYSQHALRDVIGDRNFTLHAGWYYWDFPVSEEFQDADSLCLLAEFGTGPHPRVETSCAAPS